MACFTVPATEAIITTIAGKIIKSKEMKAGLSGSVSTKADENTDNVPKISFSTKLGWLNKMLWGGSALLAFEHVWHGEVLPFFPFLTAVKDGNVAEMLHEMATTGVTMALLVTGVWAIMVGVSSIIEKNNSKKENSSVINGALA
ncbi:MAG: hypothetical protein J6J00_05340 [Treponema sp.]|nr:hypothetical protein [Treponema sp.]